MQKFQIIQNGKDKNIVSGYQSKIIATALNKPSNKAIFFNNFSFCKEMLEGNKKLKNELTKLSIYFLFSTNSSHTHKIFDSKSIGYLITAPYIKHYRNQRGKKLH